MIHSYIHLFEQYTGETLNSLPALKQDLLDMFPKPTAIMERYREGLRNQYIPCIYVFIIYTMYAYHYSFVKNRII